MPPSLYLPLLLVLNLAHILNIVYSLFYISLMKINLFADKSIKTLKKLLFGTYEIHFSVLRYFIYIYTYCFKFIVCILKIFNVLFYISLFPWQDKFTHTHPYIQTHRNKILHIYGRAHLRKQFFWTENRQKKRKMNEIWRR